MLYVTTRDQQEAVTAYKTLSNDADRNGGLYIPFQAIRFSEEQILELREKSFCKSVAEILNLFFSARLDAWDVECCIGRHPVKLVPMSHKITICEIWNNPEWNFSRFVRNLHGRILGSGDNNGHPTGWTWIAIRIAVLFGIFGDLLRSGAVSMTEEIDITVAMDDFTAPMAVVYAKEMGLPIGTVCFAWDGNGEIWDLLYHGQMQTCSAQQPYAIELERLICQRLGTEEASRYAACCDSRQIFAINEEQRVKLLEGLFCAVVSSKRASSVIRSIYRTNTYVLSPTSALAFAGLQDYRATNNETGPALILTEQGPLAAIEAVSNATGIPVADLKLRLRTV